MRKNNVQTSAQQPHELIITNETCCLSDSVIIPHLQEKELLEILVIHKLQNTNSYRTNCLPFKKLNNFPLSFKMFSSLVRPYKKEDIFLLYIFLLSIGVIIRFLPLPPPPQTHTYNLAKMSINGFFMNSFHKH